MLALYHYTDVILTKNHTTKMFKVINEARKDWYFIGEGLGFTSDDLDEIQEKHHADKRMRLHEVLQRRIQRGQLTRSMLCTSLRGTFVNRDDIAQEIEALDLS